MPDIEETTGTTQETTGSPNDHTGHAVASDDQGEGQPTDASVTNQGEGQGDSQGASLASIQAAIDKMAEGPSQGDKPIKLDKSGKHQIPVGKRADGTHITVSKTYDQAAAMKVQRLRKAAQILGVGSSTWRVTCKKREAADAVWAATSEDPQQQALADKLTGENQGQGQSDGNGQGEGGQQGQGSGQGGQGQGQVPPPSMDDLDPLAKMIAQAIEPYMKYATEDSARKAAVEVCEKLAKAVDDQRKIDHKQFNKHFAEHEEKCFANDEDMGNSILCVNNELKRLRAEIEEGELVGGAVTVQVQHPDESKPVELDGVQHRLTPWLIRKMGLRSSVTGQRLNIALVGPAGSCKTHAAGVAADALKLPFYSKSVTTQTTVSDLFGYIDANGKYVPSDFYRAYCDGGVYLLDEIDAGNPNALAVINAAVSNHRAGFPCGMVERHDDFIIVAAANTFGLGGDRQYVGRLQLDAATRNRFVWKDWGYDKGLEQALSTDKEWCSLVHLIRKVVEGFDMQIVVSLRAILMGQMLLADGDDPTDVLDEVVFQGSKTDNKIRVLTEVKRLVNEGTKFVKVRERFFGVSSKPQKEVK